MRIARIQDSIHGLMEFQAMETSVVQVLRVPELQRLRRIRQLGLVHLVFPGAEHSRLVHAIGASHLAIRFSRHLFESTRDVLIPFFRPGPSATRDLALAALFHDLGHGPLSHVWEREVVGQDFDRTAWIRTLGLQDESRFRSLKWHELVAQALLAWPEGYLHRLLEQQEDGSSRRIARLMAGEFYLPYLPRLLSSDVDVDRCDFILRDAHQTGVAYGRYDLNWLVSTATIGKTATGELVLGFDVRKAPPVIEQLLIARRALYDTVYFHKTVRAAEGMVGLLLKRFREIVKNSGWPLSGSSLFDPFRKIIEGKAAGPEDILGLDDYLLWALIHQLSTLEADETVRDLARRIVARDLFKIVPCEEARLQDFLLREDAHSRLHEAVSPFSPGQKEYYIHVDHAAFQMFSRETRESGYFVDQREEERKATLIREHPQLRSHWREEERKVRLFVPREAVDAITKTIEGH